MTPGWLENHDSESLIGGGEVVFLLGRQALKTYVRVQESSRNAMRVRPWRETLFEIWVYIQCMREIVCSVCAHAHGEARMVSTPLRTSGLTRSA